MNTIKTKSVITKKELMSAFWRSFTLQASWNYEKMMAGGFVYAMIPALKKIYPNKDDLAKALKRHLEIFNTTPQISTFILGLAISMEEENAKNSDFPTSSINSVKTSLMGPLAGIGDSFFWGTFRIIACGIGIYLGQKGSLLAPIALLVTYNIPHILAKYYGLILGYKSGASYLMKAYENGVMEKINFAASVVGLMVVGAMTATMIDIKTTLQLGVGESAMPLQDIFNTILPNLLPLLATLGVLKMIKKGIKTNYILYGSLVVGMILSFAGIM